jgi:hypothetical protein
MGYGRACYVEAAAGWNGATWLEGCTRLWFVSRRSGSGSWNGAAICCQQRRREIWRCGAGGRGSWKQAEGSCSPRRRFLAAGLEWSGGGGWSEPPGDLIWSSPEGSRKGDQEEQDGVRPCETMRDQHVLNKLIILFASVLLFKLNKKWHKIWNNV